MSKREANHACDAVAAPTCRTRSGRGRGPAPRAARGPDPGLGLRRLPHRPARRRRRAPDPKLPLVPGHEIVGASSRPGAGSTGSAVGDRVGVPWLGWTCGVCAYCRARPGEPVRRGRASPATRSTAAMPSYTVADAALLLSARPPLQRRRGGAAALRRADRLSLPAHGRRRAASGHLRLRRRRPHRGAGRAPPGPRGCTPSPGRGDAAAQDFARGLGAAGPAAPTSRRRSALDAAHHLRPGRRAGAGRACARCARAAPSSAAAST